jgi:multicomponent Na+:H+ antiporter subunit B
MTRPGRVSSLLFTAGLALLLAALVRHLAFAGAPMEVGQAINQVAPGEVGTANVVTSIVLAYRGLDTLGELTILFAAATAAGLVLRRRDGVHPKPAGPAGFILRAGADLLFPFLIVLAAYIILHGHLTPGGGFQGGAIIAAAYFVPLLSRPDAPFDETTAAMVEGGAGLTFIGIGLAGLLGGGAFLAPLFGVGELGDLVSAGSLPLLYLAVGLKVGGELAGLLAALGESGAAE